MYIWIQVHILFRDITVSISALNVSVHELQLGTKHPMYKTVVDKQAAAWDSRDYKVG
jgi:hypothetical protein